MQREMHRKGLLHTHHDVCVECQDSRHSEDVQRAERIMLSTALGTLMPDTW